MSDDSKLLEEIEKKIQYHQEEALRYKAARAALKGKAKGNRVPKLHAGGIPDRTRSLLKQGPLTPAELVEKLSSPEKKVTLRDLSIAVSKYVREEQFFKREPDGRYALIKE